MFHGLFFIIDDRRGEVSTIPNEIKITLFYDSIKSLPEVKNKFLEITKFNKNHYREKEGYFFSNIAEQIK